MNSRALERSPSDLSGSRSAKDSPTTTTANGTNSTKSLRGGWQPVHSPQQSQGNSHPSVHRTESLTNVTSYSQPTVGTSSGKQAPPRPLRSDLLEKFSVDSSPSNQQKLRTEPKPPPRSVRSATTSGGSSPAKPVGNQTAVGQGSVGTTSNIGGGWTSGTTSNDRAVRRRAAVGRSKGLNEVIDNDINEQRKATTDPTSLGTNSTQDVDLEFESFKQSMRSVNRGRRKSNENDKNELAEVFAKMKAQKPDSDSPQTTASTLVALAATTSVSGALTMDGKAVEASYTNKKDQMVAIKRMSRSTGSLPTSSSTPTENTNKTEQATPTKDIVTIPAQMSITNAKDVIIPPTEDGEYERLLQLAQTKDFSKLESLRMIYRAGVDKAGRPVVVLMMKNFVKQIETEFLLLYFIFVMDKVVENDYVLVFCNTKSSGDNRPSFSWMRKAYSLFKRKYKKNLKALYIIHPNFSIKLVFKVFKPFVSAKFWKKLVYIEDITTIFQYIERDQLLLDETVFIHNATIVKPKPVFGAPLVEVVGHYPSVSGLPPIVEKSIEYVLKRATHIEGIFRMSGTQTTVDELKRAFDRGEDVNLQKCDDIHAVASLLKLFLRDLPEPPFPFDSYDSCVALILTYKEVEVEHWTEEAKRIISGFPKPNYILLSHLFSLLACCAQRANVNKMTSSNLAIVFGPTLLRPRVETPEIVFTHIPLLNNFVKLMIDHQHIIFTC